MCRNLSSVLHESMRPSTGQAAFMSVIAALRIAKKKSKIVFYLLHSCGVITLSCIVLEFPKLVINTSYGFVIDYCESANNWRKSNWKGIKGLDVKAVTLLMEYLSLLKGIKVTFVS